MNVNGKTVRLERETTLLEYLKGQGYDCAKIAVERNGGIVPKAEYETLALQQEDVLEIVQFVGGG